MTVTQINLRDAKKGLGPRMTPLDELEVLWVIRLLKFPGKAPETSMRMACLQYICLWRQFHSKRVVGHHHTWVRRHHHTVHGFLTCTRTNRLIWFLDKMINAASLVYNTWMPCRETNSRLLAPFYSQPARATGITHAFTICRHPVAR
jgi:hypothetical protein